MIQDGIFGPDRKKSGGCPKWRLVDENLGHEIDISSIFCIPVKSKALKKTADADKEEWDILDELCSSKTPESKSNVVSKNPIRKVPIRA